MKNIAELFVDNKALEKLFQVLFALVFILFGVGKFNVDDANELAGIVVQHPVLNIALDILGPIGFANLLGVAEICIALLLLAGIKSPTIGFVGAILAVGCFVVTCSLILFVQVFRETVGFPFGNFTGLFLFKDLGLLACSILLVQFHANNIVKNS